MSDRTFPLRKNTTAGNIQRQTLLAPSPGYISPEDARAYAESLLESALYGPSSYLPEGTRKSLGALSGDKREHFGTLPPGPRKGLSGMQKNLEDAKIELTYLIPKITNPDGASVLSSIQAMQEKLDDDEKRRFYEDPYVREPNIEEGSLAQRRLERSGRGAERKIPYSPTGDYPWVDAENRKIGAQKLSRMFGTTLLEALRTWRE
ncbi:hypothetical protein [Sinorhizobium terangae]|uniref:hypothetical protein n=1 Tax=Sinorhizobium terangae TaxID=110322 RepID=UPI0024B131B4|nr:hypothetical protein [Sinorhizobium terangae]WFU49505.1 hypothetical protein QA637_08965 [Sinorhizobium terangae]